MLQHANIGKYWIDFNKRYVNIDFYNQDGVLGFFSTLYRMTYT